ncbi:hypothetical protein DPMN_075244 [Dreissena polymorpha]|uniref:Uncharacterized protein n=1 Tax=Dreissena polymorpha TaxID=45954 RepID=A0A9D3YJ71_DREPO|nr:hypothetical protein DPMN_075244 [Dreissena polymorpha]
MRAPVDPATANKQSARWCRRAVAETASVPEPAPVPVSGPEPKAAPASARPAKHQCAVDSAANVRVIDFCVVKTCVSTRH